MQKGDICDDKQRKKCLEEHSKEHLEWACKNCPKLRDDDIHPYTRKMLDVRNLQKSGFPMDADFLTYEEWLDLGKVNTWLEMPRIF